MVNRLAVVRHELLDPQRHSVFDARDLPSDLLDVGLLRAVALALAPQARVLLPQLGLRPASASAFTTGSPATAPSRRSSSRFAPLTNATTGLPAARKTSDFTI